VARKARLLAAPRIMKDRHIRLELAQEPLLSSSSSAVRAVGWDLAARAAELGLAKGSLIDLAYRIRENGHPEFGGLEVEIAGLRLFQEAPQRTEAHG
jgi:single-stranded-DNA-specific exonuclease